jgi:hypothetical protein
VSSSPSASAVTHKAGDVVYSSQRVCAPPTTVPGAAPTCWIVNHKCTYTWRNVKRSWPRSGYDRKLLCIRNY